MMAAMPPTQRALPLGDIGGGAAHRRRLRAMAHQLSDDRRRDHRDRRQGRDRLRETRTVPCTEPVRPGLVIKLCLIVRQRWSHDCRVQIGDSGGAMDQRAYIAKLNIEHFRRRLLTEEDETTGRQVTRLLAEEEAKLAALSDPPGDNKEKDKS